MEENDDDDQFQVIVFENSTEVNYEELLKENESNDDLEGSVINNKHNESVSSSKHELLTKQSPNQVNDIHADAEANAINENKVLMKYDYTHEKPWLHHTDKSAWFNYNFNERSFKNWVQHILDRRIEKAKYYQIENADNFSNLNINDIKRNTAEDNIFGKNKTEAVKEYNNKNYIDKGKKNETNNNSEKELTWKKKVAYQHYDENNSQKFKKQKILEAESTSVKNVTEKENLYNNKFPFNTNIEKEEEIEKKGKREKGKDKRHYGTEEENHNENQSGLYNIGTEKNYLSINQSKSMSFKNNANNMPIEYQDKINFNENDSNLQLNASENEKGNYDMQQFQNLINFFKENKDL